MNRVDLQPVFVLHTRPYRNTSLIVELLSQHHGRVAAVARSARGPKSRYKGCLQAFVPLLGSWSGRHELMHLGGIELDGMPMMLSGKALLSGFYLNELLMRLLPRGDAYPDIFTQYQAVLLCLQQGDDLQQHLRRFEKQLLAHLGYGLPLDRDHCHQPLEMEAMYHVIPDQGFMRAKQQQGGAAVFSGRSLLALHHDQLNDKQSLRDAKRLMRIVIAHHLGRKPLMSRELMC